MLNSHYAHQEAEPGRRLYITSDICPTLGTLQTSSCHILKGIYYSIKLMIMIIIILIKLKTLIIILIILKIIIMILLIVLLIIIITITIIIITVYFPKHYKICIVTGQRSFVGFI